MEPAHKAVADLLAGLFAAGLAQDRKTLETIASALGADDPQQALGLLAAEPDSSEHAPLMALLFSPGPELMRRVEPALARAGLDAAGAAALAQAVAKNCAGTLPLLLPDGLPAAFPASEEDVRGLVRRLKAEATAPAELRGILARRFPANLAADLAVGLRHSRLAWAPAQVFFLATLLERVGTAADAAAADLPGLLGWAAGFLDLAGPAFSPREALLRRRQALETQLRQAEAAEKAQAQGSYEVLMSQGLRLAHAHGPDVRAELGHLDRACALVLGLPGQSLPGVAVRDLGAADEVGQWLDLLP